MVGRPEKSQLRLHKTGRISGYIADFAKTAFARIFRTH